MKIHSFASRVLMATATVTIAVVTLSIFGAADPTTVPAIAFTGARLTEEWIAGGAAILLGAGLVLLARRRRPAPADSEV